MRQFFIHCALAFAGVYTALKTSFVPLPYNALSALLVFILFFCLLWMTSLFYNRTYFRKLPKGVSLAGYFIKELIIANVKIAYDIVTPHYYMRPTVIALPIRARTNVEIMLLANMITLTPGTLSIDISKNRKILYIHALYIKNEDIEAVKRHIQNGFERRLLELTS